MLKNLIFASVRIYFRKPLIWYLHMKPDKCFNFDSWLFDCSRTQELQIKFWLVQMQFSSEVGTLKKLLYAKVLSWPNSDKKILKGENAKVLTFINFFLKPPVCILEITKYYQSKQNYLDIIVKSHILSLSLKTLLLNNRKTKLIVAF